MKTLTELLKNIKTKGKNLAVYSSMLLALTGAYACGGNDNSGNNATDAQVLQDGGSNLNDTGNSNLDGGNSNALLLDCDELCQLRKDCGCNNDIDEKGRCKVSCEQGIDALNSKYIEEINKCFSNYPNTKICSVVGEECLIKAYENSCLPEGCAPMIEELENMYLTEECQNKVNEKLSFLIEAYNKKASECTEEYAGSPKNSECMSSEKLEESKRCIEGMNCSNYSEMYECNFVRGFVPFGENGLLKLNSCKK